MLDIPVFHDDQHGTAIISSAGLASALEVVGKKHSEIRIVISGAGASAISCAELGHPLGRETRKHHALSIPGAWSTKAAPRA
jgi:malate dehydrogenase (oxaloacetate-decarboxylating)(NADP+)